MYEKIDFRNAAGKTIKSVVRCGDDQLIVSFDDKTFSFISCDRSYGDSAELELNETFQADSFRTDLELSEAFGEDAAAMHAASVAERAARRRKWDEEQEQRERKQYELLKEKFERT